MITPQHNIRLTDELERQLLMRAIEEQYRFKPGKALKQLFARLAASFGSSKETLVQGQPQSAN